MTTGTHTVRDIYCVKCNQVLGWKYVRFLQPIPRSLADLRPYIPAGTGLRSVAEVQRGEVHPRAQPAHRRPVALRGMPRPGRSPSSPVLVTHSVGPHRTPLARSLVRAPPTLGGGAAPCLSLHQTPASRMPRCIVCNTRAARCTALASPPHLVASPDARCPSSVFAAASVLLTPSSALRSRSSIHYLSNH